MAPLLVSVSSSSCASSLLLLLLTLFVFFAFGAEMGAAQSSPTPNCTEQLTGLTACAPFVLPSANGAPSGQCCSALQSVAHDCICTTLQIVSRLPSQCSLPPASCSAGP